MSWVPNTAADNLPDELLATILKLVADFPVPSSARTPPAPVAASRVSRRWRTVALGSPELWTNIRISHRSHSQSWAATFVKRSSSRPLDISISLESYREWDGMAYDNPVPVSRALAIVGPHIGRWRTLALRGWSYQLQEFSEFIGSTPVAASQLEYTHLSAADRYATVTPLQELFGRIPFHSLRVNTFLQVDDATAFRAVHSLDIDCSWSDIRSLRPLFGPCSPLTTLVIRNFSPGLVDGLDPIDCSTIRSFAASFSMPFHFYNDRFRALTDTLSLPNIEHLEILGGFTGDRIEDRLLEVPEDWEAPLFPHLRTLRLEDAGFSRAGLALIQSFSRNITALQLINTTGNERLLVQPGGWPALRALAVETRAVVPPAWIASFVALRSALGGPIMDLALPPWGDDCLALAACDLPQTVIQWQRSGPSRALMDGVYGPGFYIDEYDMRPADFAHVPYPKVRKCRCCGIDWSAYLALKLDLDMELLEEDIERDFKAEGEVVRAKWTQRGARRQRRHGHSASRGSRAKRFPRNRRHGVVEDFSVV